MLDNSNQTTQIMKKSSTHIFFFDLISHDYNEFRAELIENQRKSKLRAIND
jgi:uncharacterized protein YqkB